jgi:dihydrofolate reductase / thymidylate synthase
MRTALLSSHKPLFFINPMNQPWKSLPPDMKYFKQLTSQTTTSNSSSNSSGNGKLVNAVVMGRKTWESIPPKFRPLPDRLNVILTTNPSSLAEKNKADRMVRVEADLERAIDGLKNDPTVDRIFVIGGGQVYERALSLGLLNRIYCTDVADLPPEAAKFDTYFPALDDSVWRKVAVTGGTPEPASDDKENGRAEGDNNNNSNDIALPADGFRVDAASGMRYRFVEYARRNTEEMQYLDLCRDVMDTGARRGDRTGTGTISKFGTQMRFSLRGGRLPLLTTKRTFWRGVAEELLWFISVRAFCLLVRFRSP